LAARCPVSGCWPSCVQLALGYVCCRCKNAITFYSAPQCSHCKRCTSYGNSAMSQRDYLSRLDYCNAVLAGLLASTLSPFQRVLHASARTVLDLKPRDRVTPAVQELHWLSVVGRIQYKLCSLVHKSLLGHTSEYISDLLSPVADIPAESALRASSCGNLVIPRTCMERASDRAEAASVDRLIPQKTENIFCLSMYSDTREHADCGRPIGQAIIFYSCGFFLHGRPA